MSVFNPSLTIPVEGAVKSIVIPSPITAIETLPALSVALIEA